MAEMSEDLVDKIAKAKANYKTAMEIVIGGVRAVEEDYELVNSHLREFDEELRKFREFLDLEMGDGVPVATEVGTTSDESESSVYGNPADYFYTCAFCCAELDVRAALRTHVESEHPRSSCKSPTFSPSYRTRNISTRSSCKSPTFGPSYRTRNISTEFSCKSPSFGIHDVS